MKEIIQYGSYAPSSHNAQMWRVRIVDSNSIRVFPDLNRLLHAVDPKSREAWISIGAFVENCVLAGMELGYESGVTISENGVLIVFKKAETRYQNGYLDLIGKRLTIRGPYLDHPVPDDMINNLKRFSENIHYYDKNSEEGKNIMKYSAEAYIQQTRDTAITQELSHWMIFGNKEKGSRKDGMTAEMLGLDGIRRLFFNLFINEKSVTGRTFINNSIKGAEKQLNKSSGFFLITSKTSGIPDLVNAGMELEELWLECVRNKVAIQPLSQVIEEREQYLHLKSALNLPGEIQMLVRVGMVEQYPVREKRRLTADEIIEK